jgi:nitrogenase molybdenum-cofactor synthesis protein NifE
MEVIGVFSSVEKFMTGDCSVDKGNKVCRSRGGESCAFDGAMIVLQPIADTAHIVHGPIGCLGNSWESRGSLSVHGNLHKMGFTTSMTELDVVYGSEEKLLKAVRKVSSELKPKAIFVYNTCVSGLIGEDIETVCRKAEEELDIKVIPVNAPGFVGPKNLGNRIAGEVLIDHVIGTAEAPFTTDYDINLIGEYNIAGDQWLVEPVLHEAGFRILSRITGDAAFDEIRYAHRAKLNVVVCGRALINVAQQMERKYGIPYVEVSFFGKTEMANALHAIGKSFTSDTLVGRIESVIRKEEKKLDYRLAQYEHLNGKKAVLYSGGVKSWSMISALGDLGIEVVGVGTKKSTFEDEEKMKGLLSPNAELIEDTSPKNLLSIIKSKGADMLIAGGRNLYLGVKEGIPFVDVNQERHIPYASYEGLLNLAEQIDNGIRYYDRETAIATDGAVCGGHPEQPSETAGVARGEHCGSTGTFTNSLRDGGSAQEAQKIEKKVSEQVIADVQIDPIQHSPAIGAAIAFQGVHNALPIIHGAQGCNFLGKVLITKHFREPIAMATTKLFTEDVVMGSDESLVNTIEGFVRKNEPDVIGVLSAALSEVKGDDVSGVLKSMQKGTQPQRSAQSDTRRQGGSQYGIPLNLRGTKLLHVPVPDYIGSLETGYAAAVKELVSLASPIMDASNLVLEKERSQQGDVSPASSSADSSTNPSSNNVKTHGLQVNVLVGSHLTPADVGELREIIESFGIKPIILPDLSALDGSRQGVSPLAIGGTKLEEIRAMGLSKFTIAIGASMGEPADMLKANFDIDYRVFESISGIKDTEEFMNFLSDLSGNSIPQKYVRHRQVLLDGIRDAHFYISGKRVCIALEPDLTVQLSRYLHEAGADVELVVMPNVPANVTGKIPARSVIAGDMYSINGYFDLMIASSHGENTAKKLGIPLYQIGFPTYKVLGCTSRVTIGYIGSLALINDIANLVAKH